MIELNAWQNMALGSTFRCMCNYGFRFEVYASMTIFVACFDFRIFGCMHNLKQTYDSVLKTVAEPGGKGGICPLGAALWGHKLRLECHVTTTKCQMSADVSNSDLSNVECKSLIPSCKVSSRSSRFAKGAITNLSNVIRRRLCLQQSAPACGLTDGCVTMLSDSQACELSHFVLIL